MNAMGDGWRIVLLLLNKIFIIRKRRFIVTIAEIVVPLCVFGLILGLRNLVSTGTNIVDTNTIYPLLNKTYFENNDLNEELRVLYSPQNEFTSNLMENAIVCMGVSTDQLSGYDSEAYLLESYMAMESNDTGVLALAVVFDGTNGAQVPTDLVYTMKASIYFQSSLLETNYGSPGTVADSFNDNIPFTALQMCVDDTFIIEVAPSSSYEQTVTRYIQKMPYPPYESTDSSELIMNTLIGSLGGYLFIITLFMIPSYITTEKQSGLNALLEMNGVRTYQHFFSWLISGIFLGAITVSLLTVLAKLTFSDDLLAIYYYSNGFLIWLSLLINFTHSYAFCLHIASYFSKAWIAQFTSVLIVILVQQGILLLETANIYSILPLLRFVFPSAATIGLLVNFGDGTNALTGVQWNNLFTTQSEDIGFSGSVGFTIILSILGIIFNFLAALYLYAVAPGKYGVTKSPLYFLKRFSKSVKNYDYDSIQNNGIDDQPKVLEPVADGVLTPGIQIRNLEKTFTIGVRKKDEVKAVRGISLDFYKGQITALLGHNGAGKTTLISILTGKDHQEVTLSIDPWCDQTKIQAVFGSQAEVNKVNTGSLVISLPMVDSLPETLDKIEARKTELGITGVNLSAMTLEQVFLRATEEEAELSNTLAYNTNEVESVHGKHIKLTGFHLTKQMFFALLSKKVYHAKYSPLKTLYMMLLPLLSVILLQFLRVEIFSTTEDLELTLTSLYPDSEALIYDENSTLGSYYKLIVESQGGTGTLITTEVSLTNALLERAVADISYYRNNMIVSAEFNSSMNSIAANGLFSGSATYSAPLTVNVLSNALLKTTAGHGYSIVANIGKLPREGTDYIFREYLIRIQFLTELTTFIEILFVVCTMFLITPLLENTTSVKQLQFIAGVSPSSYWGSMFVFDYAIFIVSSIGVAIGLIAMNNIYALDQYYATEIGIALLLLLLFGVNFLLLVYIVSLLKKPVYVGFSILWIGNSLLASFEILFDVVARSMEGAFMTGFLIQRRIFSLLPHISFSFGYAKFLEVASNNARCRGLSNTFHETACVVGDVCCGLECSDGQCANPLPYFRSFAEYDGLEEFILYLVFVPIALIGILYALEYKAFGRIMSQLGFQKTMTVSPYSTVITDSDVADDKRVVREGITKRDQDPSFEDENVFLAYELSKRYSTWQAVKEANFRVKQNEIFGILGVNGAGKSTIFRMLVTEETSDSGIILHGRNNIKLNKTEYLKGIGYCPQINALIPSFNAYEHLLLFAHLSGIPSSKASSEVQLWIDRLRLNKHAQKASESYSGGNKRRLNIALALVVNPELILLDEPTAGVDPGARRSLWRILQNCQASGQSIILTSHSMEECEALCNRLLIMVRGQVVCVGASQQLKQRFGAGYDVSVKLNPETGAEEHMQIKTKIQAAFVCELRDEHAGYLFYHVTDPQTTWVTMFGTMNRLKSEHICIEDFTISSSTLEQLFIQMARSAPGTEFSPTPPVVYPPLIEVASL